MNVFLSIREMILTIGHVKGPILPFLARYMAHFRNLTLLRLEIGLNWFWYFVFWLVNFIFRHWATADHVSISSFLVFWYFTSRNSFKIFEIFQNFFVSRIVFCEWNLWDTFSGSKNGLLEPRRFPGPSAPSHSTVGWESVFIMPYGYPWFGSRNEVVL